MNQVFVDTSAILSLLNPEDVHHPRAKNGFGTLRFQQASLVTTSFVLVETYALLLRRLGLDAVKAFRENLAPLIEVAWVEQDFLEEGLDLILARQQRRLSLVDAVSFLVIKDRRIKRVFAFDRHFDQEGFNLVS